MIRALADAVDSAAFGGKAVQLGAAVRARLPVPAGFAVSFDQVGEDSRTASFAGAHERVLGEAVMSGLVTLDRYRLDPAGRLLERQLGDKDMAIRRGGGP